MLDYKIQVSNINRYLIKINFSTQDFDKAAEDVKNLNGTPSNDDLLELYAFFKQANFGDNTTRELPLRIPSLIVHRPLTFQNIYM